MPRVRKDLGYPPLVTPMSQIVGVQSTANILAGERYKNVSKEVKAYFRGEYGMAPGEVDKELAAKVLDGETPITTRFADTLAPELDNARKTAPALVRNDEDLLSFIAFPQIAEKFFNEREERDSRTVTYTVQRVEETV